MSVIQFPNAATLSPSAAHDQLLETLRAATGQLAHAGKSLMQCEAEASARVEAASHLVAAGQSIVAALNAYQRGLIDAAEKVAG